MVIMDWLEGFGWAGVVAVAVSLFWDLFLPLNLFVMVLSTCQLLLAGFSSQEIKQASERRPIFTTEILEGTYRGLRDENDPTGVSGMCGLRPARGWFFSLPWPTRCGFGGLVENGLVLAGNSGLRQAWMH